MHGMAKCMHFGPSSVSMSVGVALVQRAMLVVQEDEADDQGSKEEGQQAQAVGLHRQLQAMNFGHALDGRDVQVDAAAECEEQAHGAVGHVREVHHEHANDHGQARQEVQKQRPRSGHAHQAAGEDGVVGEALRELVEHRGQGDAPAEASAAALERRAEAEAIAQVVEEVTDEHGPDHTSSAPRVGIHCRLIAVPHACRRSPPARGRSDRNVHDCRQNEACKRHGSPAPQLRHLLFPARRDEVCGLEEQQEQRTREQGPSGEGRQNALEGVGVGLGQPGDAWHGQDNPDQGDYVDDERCAEGAGPLLARQPLSGHPLCG
mmetsp:Transcript_49954/g.152025  ORF Transcript_49954/g.152025 Transcript_49954/m.152025 type:complete len:319 (-) Transcript_49954:536-1492(-)